MNNLNDDMLKTKDSEFSRIPNLSLDHTKSIRQALEKRIANTKKRNLHSSMDHDNGSRNRFNLGTEVMWSKL